MTIRHWGKRGEGWRPERDRFDSGARPNPVAILLPVAGASIPVRFRGTALALTRDGFGRLLDCAHNPKERICPRRAVSKAWAWVRDTQGPGRLDKSGQLPGVNVTRRRDPHGVTSRERPAPNHSRLPGFPDAGLCRGRWSVLLGHWGKRGEGWRPERNRFDSGARPNPVATHTAAAWRRA